MYPSTVSLSRKRNLFIRVELREDDGDARRQPLEVLTFIFACHSVIPNYMPISYLFLGCD